MAVKIVPGIPFEGLNIIENRIQEERPISVYYVNENVMEDTHDDAVYDNDLLIQSLFFAPVNNVEQNHNVINSFNSIFICIWTFLTRHISCILCTIMLSILTIITGYFLGLTIIKGIKLVVHLPVYNTR